MAATAALVMVLAGCAAEPDKRPARAEQCKSVRIETPPKERIIPGDGSLIAPVPPAPFRARPEPAPQKAPRIAPAPPRSNPWRLSPQLR